MNDLDDDDELAAAAAEGDEKMLTSFMGNSQLMHRPTHSSPMLEDELDVRIDFYF